MTPAQRFIVLSAQRANEPPAPIRRERHWCWHNAVVWGMCLLFLALFWLAVALGVRHVLTVSEGIVTPLDSIKIVVREGRR